MKIRGRRKVSIGRVVSDKMDKTIVVEVERTLRHPLYHRVIRRKNKFKAHDADEKANIGDRVKIMETRPLSKDKSWRLVEILEKGK
jgi:small subunit ribosomal protein S17